MIDTPLRLAAGGNCQKIAISSTSASSAQIQGSIVHITPSVDCYAREGMAPTAVSTGVDHFLVANATQMFSIMPNNKIAFITESLSGTVRIAVVG